MYEVYGPVGLSKGSFWRLPEDRSIVHAYYRTGDVGLVDIQWVMYTMLCEVKVEDISRISYKEGPNVNCVECLEWIRS